MSLENVITLDVDIKKLNYFIEPTVTANDRTVFVINLKDNDFPINLVDVSTITLVSKRLDGRSVITPGVKGLIVGHQVVFELGKSETAVNGRVSATVQLYDYAGRVSSIAFGYIVKNDPSASYLLNVGEITLIQIVLEEGPLRIKEATDAAIAANEAVDNIEAKIIETDAVIVATETVKNDTLIVKDATQLVKDETLTVKNDTLLVKEEAEAATIYAISQGDYAKAETDRLVGTDVSVLDNKLTTFKSETTALLAEKVPTTVFDNVAKYVTKISDFKLPIPTDFPMTKILFNLFYDFDGTIKHDYKPSITGTSVFWSEATGLDTNDGLTLTTPVKTIKKALDLANSLTGTDVVVNLMDKIYTRNTTIYDVSPAVSFQLNKNVTLNSLHEQSYIGTIEKIGAGGIAFTQEGTAWKATRSAVRWVVDIKYKDDEGKPLTYKKATSLLECQNTQGSYYTDGVSVWIRRVKDEAILSDEMLIILNTANLFIYLNSKHLMVKDISMFYNWDANQQACLKVTGTPTSKFTSINSSFSYGGGNGLELINVGTALSFNSFAYYNGHDGFNYHESPLTTTPYSFAFEYNCKGYYNGNRVGRTEGINNGSTAHEGIQVLRIGTVVYGNDGPNIADVNGCYSVNFNCLAFNSVRPFLDGRKAGFIFSDEGAVKPGKAYLFNCAGGGTDTYAIGNQSNCAIYIRKFKGSYIEATVLNTLQYV